MVNGLIVAFAIMISLISGMAGVVYVFQRVYMEAGEEEAILMSGRRGTRD